jgi:hypothetical protein
LVTYRHVDHRQEPHVSLRRALSSVAAAFLAAVTLGTTGAGAQVPDTPSDQCSSASYDDDPLLGPKDLPLTGAVGSQVVGYQRTGDLSIAAFLAQYRNPAGTAWIYPPGNGFILDQSSNPIVWTARLERGDLADWYGGVDSAFLDAQGTPYAERAIPPSDLDSSPAGPCNHHGYQVVKAFTVDAGRIAPWFAQPGGGLRYMLDPNLITNAPNPLTIRWLLDSGYLQEV